MESITKTINIDNGSVLVKITMERVRGPNPAIREDLVLDEIGEYKDIKIGMCRPWKIMGSGIGGFQQTLICHRELLF